MDPADPRFIALYDAYTHGALDRRAFLTRLAKLAGGMALALALVPRLAADPAKPGLVPTDDPRLVLERVKYAGAAGLEHGRSLPAGAAGELRGYLARPKDGTKLPAVMVIHENRGLNPHLEDVARRFALAGFLALSVDMLSPLGGTPADEDKARELIGTLAWPKVVAELRATHAYLAKHPAGNGKVGAVGYCWGGLAVGELAVNEPALSAGVVYYGRQPKAEDVAKIKAPLLLNYAGLDTRVNEGIPAFEAALKAAGTRYTLHLYEGANHAFNNDTSEARYHQASAELAWGRTVAFFKEHLKP